MKILVILFQEELRKTVYGFKNIYIFITIFIIFKNIFIFTTANFVGPVWVVDLNYIFKVKQEYYIYRLMQFQSYSHIIQTKIYLI